MPNWKLAYDAKFMGPKFHRRVHTSPPRHSGGGEGLSPGQAEGGCGSAGNPRAIATTGSSQYVFGNHMNSVRTPCCSSTNDSLFVAPFPTEAADEQFLQDSKKAFNDLQAENRGLQKQCTVNSKKIVDMIRERDVLTKNVSSIGPWLPDGPLCKAAAVIPCGCEHTGGARRRKSPEASRAPVAA